MSPDTDPVRTDPARPRPVDRELVDAAADLAARCSHGDEHTMAAAGRTADGRIVTGMNVYHFTGGPCAELVVIGAAAAEGAYELVTMVAVGSDGRGVASPCGRCRQVLADYWPQIEVVVDTGGTLAQVPVTELLPYGYVWADHQN